MYPILHAVGNSSTQAEGLPGQHPFCSFCAWGISCGNAPCAKTTKKLSGRRRRPCSRRCQSMHYLALACDYDGTLAKDGVVSPRTIDALERLKASGHKLLLVTGRLLENLQNAFPRLDLFAYVVAENGALLYNPADSTEKLLGETPPRKFLEALQERGVTPLVTGRVIVATLHPYETTVVEVINKLGLELQVIINKGAVMILPAGVNKGTGLIMAIRELKLSAHNVVGVGDD